jgi:tRNA dimethylallyltransferase
MNYRQALDKMKQNTRRYAKRQVTWFKNQFPTRWVSTKHWAKDPIFDS